MSSKCSDDRNTRGCGEYNKFDPLCNPNCCLVDYSCYKPLRWQIVRPDPTPVPPTPDPPVPGDYVTIEQLNQLLADRTISFIPFELRADTNIVTPVGYLPFSTTSITYYQMVFYTQVTSATYQVIIAINGSVVTTQSVSSTGYYSIPFTVPSGNSRLTLSLQRTSGSGEPIIYGFSYRQVAAP